MTRKYRWRHHLHRGFVTQWHTHILRLDIFTRRTVTSSRAKKHTSKTHNVHLKIYFFDQLTKYTCSHSMFKVGKGQQIRKSWYLFVVCHHCSFFQKARNENLSICNICHARLAILCCMTMAFPHSPLRNTMVQQTRNTDITSARHNRLETTAFTY
jgi:hypothetical protein